MLKLEGLHEIQFWVTYTLLPSRFYMVVLSLIMSKEEHLPVKQ